MKKLFPILLIGSLSMFFGEVFAGSSQTWFLNIWSVIVTYPLYLAHIVFFLALALRTGKTTLTQLYFFGILFGLYEALITKVLWVGYFGNSGPGFGTILGIAMPEFLVLVLFWHPVMSFILPILTYQTLTKQTLITNKNILQKTNKKTYVLILAIILLSSFVAYGNSFIWASTTFTLLGTTIILTILHKLAKKTSIETFKLQKTGMITVTTYLIIIYFLWFFALREIEIPKTILPYIPILGAYTLTIFTLRKTKHTKTEITNNENTQYTTKDLLFMLTILFITANTLSVFSHIGSLFFAITYFATIPIGILLLILAITHAMKEKKEGTTHV